MKDLKTIGTKVDPETLLKIDNLISNLGVTRSAWIKQVILRALTGSEDRAMPAGNPSAEPVSIQSKQGDPVKSSGSSAVILGNALGEPKAKNAGLDWVGVLLVGWLLWQLFCQWRDGKLSLL